MKAVTVSFDQAGDNYERLLRAFEKSWKANSDIPLQVHRIAAPSLGPRHKSFYWNHRKLKVWIDSFDQDTIFVDCDMLCMGNIREGFDLVRHIGYTDRLGDKYPFNGGVVFVKYNSRSLKFLKEWYRVDGLMLKDEALHLEYHPRYAGLNQSSMGWMWENGYRKKIAVLPDIYNKCDDWAGWEEAKMIHIKGRLRKACLQPLVRRRQYRGNARIQAIRKIWKRYDSM